MLTYRRPSTRCSCRRPINDCVFSSTSPNTLAVHAFPSLESTNIRKSSLARIDRTLVISPSFFPCPPRFHLLYRYGILPPRYHPRHSQKNQHCCYMKSVCAIRPSSIPAVFDNQDIPIFQLNELVDTSATKSLWRLILKNLALRFIFDFSKRIFQFHA